MIKGREVTLRASLPARDHPDLVALRARMIRLPEPTTATVVLESLEQPL